MTSLRLNYLIFNPQERYWNFFQCCLFTILVTTRLRLYSNWKTDLEQEDSLNVYFNFYSDQQHDFNMITSDLLCITIIIISKVFLVSI